MIENIPRMIHAQEGDNLYSIALKYNTSPSYLQVINNIYPPLITKGTDIILGSVEDVANAHHSFYVVFTSNNIEYPGTITVLPDSFVFEQRQMSLTSPKLVYPINIVSIVQSSLFPHPSINSRSYNDPAQPAILIICFLADPFNQKNVEVATFEGPRAELNALYILIQSRSKNRQSKIKFNISEHAQHAAELKTIDSLEEHNKPAYLRSKAVIKAQQVIFGESKILDMVDIFSIRRELPYRFRALAWTKIFSISEEGTTFTGLFEVAEQSRTSLLIMKADNGIRLGCFLPQGLKYSSKVYGFGDIFVFNFAPELNCFKWSRKNTNFITATNTEVMIGAGKEGGAAIYFTKFMDNGRSDYCETFSSPPLALREDFHILDLEIWDISYKQTSIVKKNA